MPSAVPVVACIHYRTDRSLLREATSTAGEAATVHAFRMTRSRCSRDRSSRAHSHPTDGLRGGLKFRITARWSTLGASRSRPQQNEGLRQPAPEPSKITSAREKRREDTRRKRARPNRGPDN